MIMETIILPIWDWSNDGHWKTDFITIISNKSVKELQQAYLKAEKKYWINIFEFCQDYGDSYIDVDNYKKLIKLWIVESNDETEEEDDDDEDGVYMNAESLAEILLNFIKLELQDFNYEVKQSSDNYLFWYWSKKLNRSLGYWLFD